DYFGSNPGSLLMNPTLAQPQAVTVLQPPLNLRITRAYHNNSFTASPLLVYAKLDNSGTGDGCTEPQVPLTLMSWPSPAGTWGTPPGTGAPTTNWVSQQGATFDPCMPYGKYTICLRDTNAGRYQTFTYDNARAG